MRCLMCGNWAFTHICSDCRGVHLAPTLHTRKIAGKMPVHSFYRYDEIESLLLTKHTDLGHYVYSVLAKCALRPFARSFDHASRVAVIGIDDHVRHGYSHTAILAKAMKTQTLKPRFSMLRDHSGIRYSGRDFQYRLTHPRAFRLWPFPEKYVILVDDILTTGLTLTQGVECVHAAGKEVLFCLTLADADNTG